MDTHVRSALASTAAGAMKSVGDLLAVETNANVETLDPIILQLCDVATAALLLITQQQMMLKHSAAPAKPVKP